MNLKKKTNQDAKNKIGKKAAELIQNNDTLFINSGTEVIRAQFIVESGDEYLLLCRYDLGEADSLYNNWLQKFVYGIDSYDHDDQFFILDMNTAKPKHYTDGSPEYEYVQKLFNGGILTNEKKPVKVPIARCSEFEGLDGIIHCYSWQYANLKEKKAYEVCCCFGLWYCRKRCCRNYWKKQEKLDKKKRKEHLKKFGIDDEMSHAITVHTRGSENMSLLDKIIFLGF